jgi:serine/threonine protein kinase
LNSGTFGFVELALDKKTGQQVAVKFIERGEKVLLSSRGVRDLLVGPDVEDSSHGLFAH